MRDHDSLTTTVAAPTALRPSSRQTCGYCERIAAQAVSIAPEYRTEVLRKYAEIDDTLATGGLWRV